MDLPSFGRRMRVLGATVEENATAIKRKVALAVDAELVMSTPVDTGRARANWQVELNTSPAAATEDTDFQSVLAKNQGTIAKAGVGDTIYVTNNLPYIGRLNEGWSAQAPAGFVETAVLNGAARVRGARLLIKTTGGSDGN